MKRNLAVLAVMAVVLWVACENREAADILEPAFGQVPCSLADIPLNPEQPGQTSATRQDLYDYIDAGIDELFDTRNSRKAAHDHLDNIARDVCNLDWDGALSHVNSFAQQVDGQPDEKLNQPGVQQLAANLVNWAILLATDPESIGIVIPAEAFSSGGFFGIVDPTYATGTVTTGDNTAGVDTNDFGTQPPFIVAIAPSQTGVGYEIVSNGDVPAAGVLIQMCGEDFLTLGHWLDDGSTELLEPVDLEAEGRLAVGCSGASAPARTGSLSRLPSWMRTVGRLAGHAARKVFGPAPLYADYFTEKGLGGLAKAFSPFAPVTAIMLAPDAATIEVDDSADLEASLFGTAADLTRAVTWTTDNGAVATVVGTDPAPADPDDGRLYSTGTVTAHAAGTAHITVTFTGTYSTGGTYTFADTATITVPPPMRALTVMVEDLTPYRLVVTDDGSEFSTSFSCITASTGSNGPLACTDKPLYPAGSVVKLNAVAEGYDRKLRDWVPLDPAVDKHDITIWGEDMSTGTRIVLCDLYWPRYGDPTGAWCEFEMPNANTTIRFTLTQ